ncbi:Predicted nucleic acid-binding protein, contains PIN domain [Algoriphagus locisalis]|uniref:Predicted nucleic acid-binding protein, contains PIN domain n=1 Tax=Algoriphagus locisalis TaxID=305507 RepID=A0A1I6XKE2_9BACT|nr:PIN domain-containing protein [Algoriphagus locisalis]SFT38304.1 Predicted nucleic acid-binding protein, contains PIN domain [Algoriphagus locisalis]
MKIFFDVNVLLYMTIKRTSDPEKFSRLLNHLSTGKIQGFITTGVVQTCAYFLLKLLDYEKTSEILTNLIPNFDFLDGKKSDVQNALAMKFPDIEDAIFYQIALDHNLDAIVTSDRDFLKLSKPFLPVITPEELTQKLSN